MVPGCSTSFTSDESDAPDFSTVDWSSYDRSRRRLPPGLLVASCGTVVAALALYDRYFDERYPILEWLPQTVDWIVLWGGVVLFAFVGVPAIRRRDQTRRLREHLFSRPTRAMATLVSCKVVGDSLRDALDPRHLNS